MTSKEYREKIYVAALLTVGAGVISLAGRKTMKEPMGFPTTISGSAKLLGAYALSAALIKVLVDKKWLSNNPFETS